MALPFKAWIAGLQTLAGSPGRRSQSGKWLATSAPRIVAVVTWARSSVSAGSWPCNTGRNARAIVPRLIFLRLHRRIQVSDPVHHN